MFVSQTVGSDKSRPVIIGEPNDDEARLVASTALIHGLIKGNETWVSGSLVQDALDRGWFVEVDTPGKSTLGSRGVIPQEQRSTTQTIVDIAKAANPAKAKAEADATAEAEAEAARLAAEAAAADGGTGGDPAAKVKAEDDKAAAEAEAAKTDAAEKARERARAAAAAEKAGKPKAAPRKTAAKKAAPKA